MGTEKPMFSTHTILPQTTLRSVLFKDSRLLHRRRWPNAPTVRTKCTRNSTTTMASTTTASKLFWLHSLEERPTSRISTMTSAFMDTTERNKSSRRLLPTSLSGCTLSVNWKTPLMTAKKHAPSKTVTMTPSTRGTRLQPSTPALSREPTDLDPESLLTLWPIRAVEIWPMRPEEPRRSTLISSRT